MMNKLNEQEFNPAGDFLRRKWQETVNKYGLGRKNREQAGARLEIERTYKDVYATFQRNAGRGLKPTAGNLYKWLINTYDPEFVETAFKSAGVSYSPESPDAENKEEVVAQAAKKSTQPISKKEFAKFNAALAGEDKELGKAIHDWLNKMGIDIPKPGTKEAREVFKGMKYLGVFKDTPIEKPVNEVASSKILPDRKVREIIYYTVQQHILHSNMENANADNVDTRTLRIDAKVLADQLQDVGVDQDQIKYALKKAMRESRNTPTLDFDNLYQVLKQTGISESEATRRIYNRMITEAGNALDWKWINTGSYYLANFTSGNKQYQVYAEDEPDYSTDKVTAMSFELSSGTEDKYELTGFNEQFKVFATVAEIGIDLINKEHPDMIIISINSDNYAGFESAVKRQRKALLKMGYELYNGYTDIIADVIFIIKKDVDINELNDQSRGMVYVEGRI